MTEKLNRKQKQMLKELTGGLGKVEVVDGEISCYVDCQKLAIENGIGDFFINVNGVSEGIFNDSYLKENNLYDKKINYIFSNMWFHNDINICSLGKANLVFENCTFTDYIYISNADNIVFKKNEYRVSSKYDSKFYFCTSDDKEEINSITFDDDNLISISNSKCGKMSNINIDIYAKNVNFKDTGIDKCSTLNINCDTLSMQNNIIDTKEMEIYTDKIINDGSDFIEAESVVIEDSSNNYGFTSDIYYKNLFFNGVEFSNDMDCVITTEREFELQKNRVLLADTLRNVYGISKNNIDNKLTQVEKEMEKKSVVRTLKK